MSLCHAWLLPEFVLLLRAWEDQHLPRAGDVGRLGHAMLARPSQGGAQMKMSKEKKERLKRKKADEKLRRKYVAELVAWWDEEVGERPSNLLTVLGGLVKQVEVDAVRAALKRAAEDDSLQDAEDVLERVLRELRSQRKPQDPGKEATPREKHRQKRGKLLAWWDAEVGERPPGLEETFGNWLADVSYEAVLRSLMGARVKRQEPTQVLELAGRDLRDYRDMSRKRSKSTEKASE